MVVSRQIERQKKRKSKREIDTSSFGSLRERKEKLKELDDFMEAVLQEAGEEFLDEFRQVGGE